MFKIDLHVHSKFSGDTDADPEELIIQAIEAGLSGIAFTEHYSYEASDPVERFREKYEGTLKIFRGVEFSSAEGHCLIFGVNTDSLSMKRAPIHEIIRLVGERGGVVIPSHPYRGENSLGDKVRKIEGFCALEGYNGCNLHPFNLKAVQTACALSLPFTGGSDAHAPREVGLCFTEFVDAVDDGNLVALLKTGRYRGVDMRKVSTVSRFYTL